MTQAPTIPACHERGARVSEARRFSRHLILHGWSPQEVEAVHGYRVLGLGR